MSNPNIAFSLVAIGPSALRPYADYAIDTLRHVGGYDGNIFLLTDHPECYDFSSKSTHVVEISSPETSLEQNLRNPKYKRTLVRMLKTELLKLIPMQVEYVVFLDSDIITTQENCVADFLETNVIRASWGTDMGIRARWVTGTFVHLGSFILRRGYSEGLLAEWRGEFTEDDYLDRISFMKAVGKRLGIEPDDWNTEDESVIERRRSIVGDLVNGDTFLRESAGAEAATHGNTSTTPTCFTHISGARCDAYGKDFVDKVVERYVQDYRFDYCRDTSSWRGWALFKLERLGVSVEESCSRKASREELTRQEDRILLYGLSATILIVVYFASIGVLCLRRMGMRKRSKARGKR